MNDIFVWSAVIGGSILALQTLMTAIGIGADDLDADPALDPELADDAHHAVFGVLSFRALVAFATFFGLAGLASQKYGLEPMACLAIASGAGLASIWLVGSMMKAMTKLQSKGNLDLQNAVGKDGEIYLRVPAQRGGQGRVHVDVQGRRVECKAMTEGPELLPGVAVTVVGLVTANVLLVESA